MINLQYLVSGALSLFVSIYVLVKRPRTLALKYLFFFGLVVSIWEISSLFSRIAPDAITSANLFTIVLVTSHLCFPIYLLTILNIREKRSRKILLVILIPAIIQAVMMLQKDYLANYEFFSTEFGWSYRVISYQLPLIIVSVIFIGYLVGIFIVLFSLTSKTRFPLLKRKYTILFISFTCFQAVGTTLVNALIAFGLLNPNFRIGGVLQLLTFLSIWYALSLKEKGIPLPFIEGKDFSQIYSSFLTVYYNSTFCSQLGEEVFKFTDFLRNSKLENKVLLDKNEIIFKETEDLNLGELITRNLKFFDKNPVDYKIIDRYLRVLNAADKKLGWRFEVVVKENKDFLKKSDLIYGISEGKFLEKIVEDESLRDLDNVEACLKIYKRVLYPILGKIISMKIEFQKKLLEHYVTGGMEITDFGEISIKDVKDRLMKVSEDQRLSLAIERFNSVLSWVYERIFKDSTIDIDVEDILRKLRLVLTLNKDKAADLGVYPTLLGTLATKIPQTQIHRLYSDYLEELVEERTRELKETQEKLLKSQRLAAIGEAAAMVGHDLRNPLQTIVNTLYLTEKKLKSSQNKGLKEMLETVQEEVEYMNKIVSDLQDYARPLKPNLVETNIHQLIKEMLLTTTIPKDIKVSIMVEKGFPKLEVDPTFMKRVFTNLIINSVQAMPEGGRLEIRLKKTEKAAFIILRDTGIGISEENLGKIFQPLFTTKSKGIGLGLAVCKRLVESLGGSIMVESKVGEGSTFKVIIPLIKNKRQIVSNVHVWST